MIHNPFHHEILVEATDPLPFPNDCPCGAPLSAIRTRYDYGTWITICDDCHDLGRPQGVGETERASILDWNEQVGS